MVKFGRIRRIHFVGIGGIGMSGIAELLRNQGYEISGSDLGEGPSVMRLRGLGARIHVGHDASHVDDADVVVFSSAVRPTNPELRAAEARKIPVIPRAEMLSELMRLKHGVAVAGSHGKPTTTSLIAHILVAAGLDPTAVSGGRVLHPGRVASGARLGAGQLLVAEADESDGSFLDLAPVFSVITNIDPEHLDHYGSVEALRDAFVRFANRVPFWGATVVCIDHPGVQAILPRLTRRTATFGFSSQADLVAADVERDGWSMRFRVRRGGQPVGLVRVGLPGRHNVANALAALAIALELEVPFGIAGDALADFPGIERRFQRKGEAGGVLVVDDYAHHPAEIRATLAAARALRPERVVTVFQPHRYTRTRDLVEEFQSAFLDADLLVVTEIHAAGEDKIPGVEGAELVRRLAAHGQRDVRFVADLDEVPEALGPELRAGDLVLTLGAGSITGLAPKLLARLRGEYS